LGGKIAQGEQKEKTGLISLSPHTRQFLERVRMLLAAKEF
jgi:hypothetical protein